MLMDIYGSLLTPKQRDYMNLYYNDDLSLQEIAEFAGISRQGVHDLIKRGEMTLKDTEKKLGFMKRLTKLDSELQHIEERLSLVLKKCEAMENPKQDINNGEALNTQPYIKEDIAYLLEKARSLLNATTGG